MFAAVAVAILLILLRTADADVEFSDLPGLYDLVRQGLPFCGKVLNIQSAGVTVTSMKFDGIERCLVSTITLQQIRLDASASESANVGTLLASNGRLLCQSKFVTMLVTNVARTVEWKVTGFADPYEFRAGIKYIHFAEKGIGACVYQQRGATPSRRNRQGNPTVKGPGGGSDPGPREGETGGVGGGSGGDSSIWVWLGPIIGAVATVVGALITVYCVRKGKESDESVDAPPGGPAGIAGGLHINFGQQGGHAQNLPQLSSSSAASNQQHWHDPHPNVHAEHYQKPPFAQPY